MANPFDVTPLGGLNLGSTYANAVEFGQQQEDRAMQQQAMQVKAQQQAQLQELAQKAMSGDYNAAAQIYAINPEYAAQIDKGLGIKDEREAAQVGGWIEKYLTSKDKQAYLEETAALTPFTLDDDLLKMDPIERDGYVSLAAGRYLNKEQLSMLGGTSKDTPDQQNFKYFEGLQERDPEKAKQFGIAKGYIETGREQQKTEKQRDWETYKGLKKTNPQDAKAYGQAAGFVSKEGRELSVAMQKRNSDAIDASVKASADVIKYNDLASQVEDAGIQGGWGGRGEEILKEITGQQDFKSQLRRDFYAIRGAEVVNNLPPGAASDPDVQMAKAGFPSDNAGSGEIAQFLRGLSKIKEFEKKYNEFKADFISENGSERGMLQAWKGKDIKLDTTERTLNLNSPVLGRTITPEDLKAIIDRGYTKEEAYQRLGIKK